jgi:hypothetical protein
VIIAKVAITALGSAILVSVILGVVKAFEGLFWFFGAWRFLRLP